jgi:hypothetical protein
VNSPRLPTSLAVDPWIPLPPAAAPAAGGWGIHGSRVVDSVGVGVVSSCGVLKAEMSSVCLQVAVVPFDGGGPWSSAVDLLPSACSQLGGAGVRVFPLPVPVGRRIRLPQIWWKMVMVRYDDNGGHRGRSSGPVLGDFPLAGVCSQSKASRRVAATARHR